MEEKRMAMRVDEKKQKEKIKIQMSDFLKKYKRRPTKHEYYNRYNLSCPRTIKKYYGSIDNLLRECGEHVPITIREVTREDIIRQIKDFYKREGRLPKKEEFILSNDLPTIQHIKKYFRGITEAKIASGFNVSDRTKEITEEEVIKAIQNFHEQNERLPNKNEIKAQYGFPSINKVKALFGSLRFAYEAAGFKTSFRVNKYEKIEVESLVVEKYKEKGRRLTFKEINEDKELPTYRTVCNILRKQKLSEMWDYLEEKYRLKRYINRKESRKLIKKV
jgi:hypothetical protein